MAETHQVVTKVWIEPGCIVCDACESDCVEVFDVQEETCLIRPPAMNAEFLAPLTEKIKVAAEGCPVEVIKFEVVEREGPAPATTAPAPAVIEKKEKPAPAAAKVEVKAEAKKPAAPGDAAPAEKKPAKETKPEKRVRPNPPDPKRKFLELSEEIAAQRADGMGSGGGDSVDALQAASVISAVKLPADAPPDQRAAILAAGGAYAPSPTLAQRLRAFASRAREKMGSRRSFNLLLGVGWGAMLFCGATATAMFTDFLGNKAPREPRKVWRVGKLDQFLTPNAVDERFKRTPAGGEGFWLVNLGDERKLVALSTICTHLGCIPNWLASDQKFKCPCHGSGFYANGVNFEGPTPRSLERFRIYIDSDGQVVVDQTKVYRDEMGEWDNPESYIVV